ncbi:MAG: tRNA (adenosine(37)-N6)-threonylcarbamoyltransferase complex dimerization subunit type 1 TsaB [Oscillospiraceae bacterium]|jgi:tRNA threonylcarbamoyladenosine biosynthesis protein TsaB|nr:tRNA (adenosine(37)-N6)-threonylcarbamoyltransferase complex dimerization subunit type 1 TsaB [Oscillospiraceae bacterium]
MKILALESSAKAASCAVLSDGELLASAWQATGLTHSRTLLPMVEDMLNNSELSVQEIDAVAVAAGPGSFTGLRIGIAAVKGLAWAAEKPCIPVSTLEAMAWPLAHLEGNIICAMDARRQQIYNAVFLAEGGELTRLREDRAVSLEEAAADVGEMDGPMTIVGDGAGLCFDFLTARGVECRLAPVHLRQQSAVGVAMAAWRRRGENLSAQELTPVYLRLSQAERERLAKGESI